MKIPKMGFEQRTVTHTYGRVQEITCDGRTFTVKSDAEAIFFRQLEVMIRAGAVKEWWYEPKAFPLTYKHCHEVCRDTYTPDARVVWVNPDVGEEYYEIKRSALEAKYANKILRFCRQYPDKKVVLVWVGRLPTKGKVANRIAKLRPWLDHIWEIRQ